MKTIAIDALGISRAGGGRSATLNLLRAMLPLDTTNQYLLLLDQFEPELCFGAHVQQIIVPVRQRIACRLYAAAVWPFELRRRHVDLVHHVKNLRTQGLPGRSVMTIYDLTILVHPELYPLIDVWYWRYCQGQLLRGADRVIAISEQTARDLQTYYRLDQGSLRVIYPAYDPRFGPVLPEQIDQVRQDFSTGQRFILHVGSISRKKNLLVLVKAFERLVSQGYPGKLVLAGAEYNKGHDDALFAHIGNSPHRSRVVFTGYVPDEDMPALYNASELMVFPSLHEGFGIAPVEAMACGTPVISSSGGALGEVVGQGGVVLSEVNDELLAYTMAGVLDDPAFRCSLIDRGFERVKQYSIHQAAMQTLAVYEELLR